MVKETGGKVTTREFYEALLEIKPTLQRVSDQVESLHDWAQGPNGVEKRLTTIGNRLDCLERLNISEAARKKAFITAGRILWTLFVSGVAMISALIGKRV